MSSPTSDQVVDATVAWLEQAVIGLNLCPFAKAVHVKRQIRYVVSTASTADALAQELATELLFLAAAPADEIDTTLLIHPEVLTDFYDYNDFLAVADEVVRACDLEGVLQVASFHPEYQFGNTVKNAIENCTNRSPFPLLHLLREESIARAVEAFPEADAIFDRNIDTMRLLGWPGWQKLRNFVAPK